MHHHYYRQRIFNKLTYTRRMFSFNPLDIPIRERHQHIISAVGPRPIAWASTMNKDGKANLAPYSFFNAFGSNPPTLVFSSNRRGRNNTTKDTLHNIEDNREVVINVVSQQLLHQMTISSTEYNAEVDEFVKAGVSKLESETIRPYRVKESPVQFECKVTDIVYTGKEGGAANLFICNIERMHMDERILDENGRIDAQKIQLMGRMGGSNYVKAFGDSVIEINNPFDKLNLGFDQLPDHIKHSTVLSGNDIAKMAMLTDFPNNVLIESIGLMPEVSELSDNVALHQLAQQWLDKGEVEEAFALLLSAI